VQDSGGGRRQTTGGQWSNRPVYVLAECYVNERYVMKTFRINLTTILCPSSSYH